MRKARTIDDHEGGDWLSLQSVLESHQCDLDTLEELRHVINPPHVLTSFAIIVENLSAILKRIQLLLACDSRTTPELANKVIRWSELCEFITSICLRQLDIYQEHLSHFENWLFMHNQDLFFASRQKDITGRRLDRKTPSLFFIQNDLNGLEVRPKWIKKLMTHMDYGLPVNANRHYLRTNLLDRGCPIEVINAFMGHWESGVEPWGMYSGLSPLVYRNHLFSHLLCLMDDCGWELEKGLSGDSWRK